MNGVLTRLGYALHALAALRGARPTLMCCIGVSLTGAVGYEKRDSPGANLPETT